MNDLMPSERIESKIFLIRGQKVMLDKDLAELYGVETKALNQAVNRNLDRFPEDFMFKLTKNEFENLKFHFGTSNLKSRFVTSSWGGTRKLPRAFTEQGVAMLSSVLRSKRAIHVNIAIMRVFVRLKRVLSTHKEVSRKLKELEQKYNKHDADIKIIFDAIRKLIGPDRKRTKRIDFIIDK